MTLDSSFEATPTAWHSLRQHNRRRQVWPRC